MPDLTVRLTEGEWAQFRAGLWEQSEDASYLESWQAVANKVATQMAPHEQQPTPEAVYTPVVMQDALLEALKRAEAACSEQWGRARSEDRTAYSGAATALRELRHALLNPNRDGSGGQPADEGAATPDPAAQTTPEPSLRPMEIAWPSELDPDDRAGIARQLDAIGHSSGLTYWNDVAKAIRSIRPPR